MRLRKRFVFTSGGVYLMLTRPIGTGEFFKIKAVSHWLLYDHCHVTSIFLVQSYRLVSNCIFFGTGIKKKAKTLTSHTVGNESEIHQ